MQRAGIFSWFILNQLSVRGRSMNTATGASGRGCLEGEGGWIIMFNVESAEVASESLESSIHVIRNRINQS